MDPNNAVDSVRTAVSALCVDIPLSLHIWVDWMEIFAFSMAPGEKCAGTFP